MYCNEIVFMPCTYVQTVRHAIELFFPYWAKISFTSVVVIIVIISFLMTFTHRCVSIQNYTVVRKSSKKVSFYSTSNKTFEFSAKINYQFSFSFSFGAKIQIFFKTIDSRVLSHFCLTLHIFCTQSSLLKSISTWHFWKTKSFLSPSSPR